MDDFDIREFFQAADAQRAQRGLTWAAATREINALFQDVPGSKPMATSTITGMRSGKTMIEGDSGLQLLLWLDRSPESFVPGMRSEPGMHNLRQPDPSRILRWDLKTMHAALDIERGERGMTWQDVASEIDGFTPSMLTRMAKGGRTRFPQVMRVVQWLGQPARDFTMDSER